MLKKYLNKDGKVKYRIKQLVKNSTKAQSAMEYLMTYGWSILIIAIVLVSLFELGIFGSSSLSGNGSCIAQTQFLCTKPILASNGILMATIGETLGQITLTGTACLNNTAQPSSSSFNSVSPPVIINNGETFQIGFYCPITSNAIGTSFNGNLWMQYNTPAASGQIIKIGSVSLKVTLSATSSSGGSGGSPVYYTPITLSNQQSSATASGFQQMIYFNPSTYSSNEMANLSNIEFTAGAPIGTSGNVPLYAWIESGASSTATNTVAWVNLASNTLGAAGSGTNTLTIYMNFLPDTSPVTSGYTGYAPQLYCASGCFQTSYAQYDDGADMFNNYWNFAGTLLPSGLNAVSGTAGTDYIVNNGIQILTTTTRIQSTVSLSGNYILDGYHQFISNAKNGWDFGVYASPSAAIGMHVDGGGNTNEWSATYYFNNGYTEIASAGETIGSGYYYIWQIINNAGSITTNFDSPEYSVYYTSSFVNSVSAPITFGERFDNNFGGQSMNDIIYWIRTRAYPPNGVMPSTSFGSIV